MLLGKHYLFLFASKTHKKFPSQLDNIGLFRYIKIELDSESVRTKTKESG